MGKYVGYVILILIVLFAVEYFGIVDIPYFDIPDYFSGKEGMMDKSEEALKQLKWYRVGGTLSVEQQICLSKAVSSVIVNVSKELSIIGGINKINIRVLARCSDSDEWRI